MSIIIPKKVMTLNVAPVNRNARMTPVNVNGTANITINGSKSDSNCAAITI